MNSRAYPKALSGRPSTSYHDAAQFHGFLMNKTYRCLDGAFTLPDVVQFTALVESFFIA
jgi:hypothetical protein